MTRVSKFLRSFLTGFAVGNLIVTCVFASSRESYYAGVSALITIASAHVAELFWSPEEN